MSFITAASAACRRAALAGAPLTLTISGGEAGPTASPSPTTRNWKTANPSCCGRMPWSLIRAGRPGPPCDDDVALVATLTQPLDSPVTADAVGLGRAMAPAPVGGFVPDRPATNKTTKPAPIATARHVAAMISCRFSVDFLLGCKAASGGGGCRGAWTSPTHGARTTWVRASSGSRLRGAGVSASGPPRGALTGVDGAFEGATGSIALVSRSP